MDKHSVTIDEEIANVWMQRPHVVIVGAGASAAAFPAGDRNGNSLPIMNNLVDTIGLGPMLEAHRIDHKERNFESIFSELFESGSNPGLLVEIEQRVSDYFDKLALPDKPTIYDDLVLSLRPKDLIATFNWDPFLYMACLRNHGNVELPHVVYLHGNVRIGYCDKDWRKGMRGTKCSQCGGVFRPSRLLFPIKRKKYNSDPYIAKEWNTLQNSLKSGFMLTIFGYGAPDSDVESVTLMNEAWRASGDKELEEIEIIDIKEDEELAKKWGGFIHSHHYQTTKSFFDSWIARHPRRTCEAMWSQCLDAKFVSDNFIPQGLSLDDLWDCYEPILETERNKVMVK